MTHWMITIGRTYHRQYKPHLQHKQPSLSVGAVSCALCQSESWGPTPGSPQYVDMGLYDYRADSDSINSFWHNLNISIIPQLGNCIIYSRKKDCSTKGMIFVKCGPMKGMGLDSSDGSCPAPVCLSVHLPVNNYYPYLF